MGANRLRVAHAVDRRLEFAVTLQVDTCAVDLAQLVVRQLPLPFQCVAVTAELLLCCQEISMGDPEHPVFLLRCPAGVRQQSVDEAPQLRRPGDPQLIVLTDDLHKVAHRFVQRIGRGDRTIEVGPTAGAPRKPSGYGYFSVLCVEEPAFDNGLVGKGPDEIGAGVCSQKHAQGTQQQRLPRSGLARDHRESRTRFQTGLLDDAEVAHSQFVEHQSIPNLRITREPKPSEVKEMNFSVASPGVI